MSYQRFSQITRLVELRLCSYCFSDFVSPAVHLIFLFYTRYLLLVLMDASAPFVFSLSHQSHAVSLTHRHFVLKERKAIKSLFVYVSVTYVCVCSEYTPTHTHTHTHIHRNTKAQVALLIPSSYFLSLSLSLSLSVPSIVTEAGKQRKKVTCVQLI